jgi:hypothetical protein
MMLPVSAASVPRLNVAIENIAMTPIATRLLEYLALRPSAI